MIGKQVLAFGKSEKSELINIRIFAASSGGPKGRRHIGRFTPDRERSHVWAALCSSSYCYIWMSYIILILEGKCPPLSFGWGAFVQTWHFSLEGKHPGGLLSVHHKTWLCSHNILDGVLLFSHFQHWQKNTQHFAPFTSCSLFGSIFMIFSYIQKNPNGILCLHVFSFTTFSED